MSTVVDFVGEWVARGYDYLLYELHNHPAHVVVDAIMVAALIYVLRVPVHKANDHSHDKPTKEEEEEIIREFQSAPFEVPKRDVLPDLPAVQGYNGAMATLEGGQEVVNAASFDFLCYATEPSVVETAQNTIVQYGCGSCGPRGFYGSLKPHVDFEERLAKFTKTDAGIIYSFSFATISTLISAFASRGDEIVVDAGVCLPVQIGCRLSRALVNYFKHNDVAEAEKLMKESHDRQAKKKKRVPPRRWLIIEGIYRNTGYVARLPELLKIAKKYKYRIILEDSLGFGAVGPTGRGTPDLFGLKISDFEIYVGSMSTALGTVGGFCVGSASMVDHQRLTATGYVFSASLPPYASAAAMRILDIIDSDASRVRKLQENAAYFRKLFVGKKTGLPANVTMLHDDRSEASPVVHFAAASSVETTQARRRFFEIGQDLIRDGFMTAPIKYNDQERVDLAPSIRICVKSEHTKEQLDALAKALATACTKHFA